MDMGAIILKLSKEPDIVGNSREKWPRKCTKKTIVVSKNRENMTKKRDIYQDRHFFEIDKKAMDRVLDLIDQMIASQER